MKDTIIVGVCATGRVVLDCLIASGRGGEVAGFAHVGEKRGSDLTEFDGCPVLETWDGGGVRKAIVAVGTNALREETCEALARKGLELISAVHPSATVTRGVELGRNVILAPGVTVGVGSRIGDGVFLNTSCSIDHDCEIDGFAHVCPGAHLAGTVKVGRRSWIGIGSCVSQGITIGEDVFVGAGAVVVKDLPAAVLAYGVPARVVRELEEHERGRIIT